MWRLWKYSLRFKRFYFIAFLGLFLGRIASSALPLVARSIIDDVLVAGNGSLFLSRVCMIALFAATIGFSFYYEEYFSDRLTIGSGEAIRRDLFRHIEKMDASFFGLTNPGELMSRTVEDVSNVTDALGYCLIYTVEIIFGLVLNFVLLWKMNHWACLVPLSFMPFIISISIYLEIRYNRIYSKISDETAAMNEKAGETLTGIRTVKAFGREKTEEAKFRIHNSHYKKYNIKADYLNANWSTPLDAISRIMIVASLFISGIMVIRGNLTVGTAAAVISYIEALSWPMQDIGWAFDMYAKAFASSKKITRIMDAESSLEDGEKEGASFRESLEFKNVSFSVEGKDILSDISFRLENGKSLGIMGSSGSGKTTICNLIMRVADTTGGGVYFDGENVKDLKIKDVRKLSSFVSQDVFLFSDRIDENIKIGRKKEMSRDEVISSLTAANAMDFVEKLDEKEGTVIGERGVGLSGGQKQRLSIARALGKNAPLLILDDATSALDMETEKEIERSIRESDTESRIIIAHRISAVRHCDEILYLEEGRVAERGTHDELLKKKGLYYETYISQYGRMD